MLRNGVDRLFLSIFAVFKCQTRGAIIADVITQYANREIDYTKAEFNARVKIYQSVNPNFNPDVEYKKDLQEILRQLIIVYLSLQENYYLVAQNS